MAHKGTVNTVISLSALKVFKFGQHLISTGIPIISSNSYFDLTLILLQVKEVEDKISARKAEVEKLIREMREANLESLAISPPEESKQFLDGENE